jgi:hypothetical protein
MLKREGFKDTSTLVSTYSISSAHLGSVAPSPKYPWAALCCYL